MPEPQNSLPRERMAAFAFGVAFVLLLIVLSLAVPSPTPFQYTVFRIVLALAAAGVAVFIPGIINVKIGSWLRAGGALAVFVVVYFFSPAALVSKPQGAAMPPNVQQIGNINQQTDSGSNTAGTQGGGTDQNGKSSPKNSVPQKTK